MEKIEKLENGNIAIDGVEYAPVSQKESEKRDKKASLYGKHPEKFEVGHWYKCVVKERPAGWNPGGLMDAVLDGKPHLCTAVDKGWPCTAAFDVAPHNGQTWSWGPVEFIEVPAPKAKKYILKRNDPVFVWDDITPDRIPAIVLYAHHINERGKIIVWSSITAGGEGLAWDHYRKFDPALVGVPRKDWPKED